MTNKKFNFVKVGFMILLCFGIVLLGTNHSQATPYPAYPDAEVSWDRDSYANLTIDGTQANYYTDYSLDLDPADSELPLEAFCVENVGISDDGYELIPVEDVSDDDKLKAAIIADNYFNNPDFGSTNEDGNFEKYTKEEVQIAIWEIVFDDDDDLGSGAFKYNSGGPDDFDRADAQAIVNNAGDLDYTGGPISLAHSPAGTPLGDTMASQDYLVPRSVPDADIMWLLGPAFIMLGLLGRKKSKEYF
jgi:hypothetical protein